MTSVATQPTRASASPFTASNRIPELDGLRGFAILLVLLWHYLSNGTWPIPPGTFFSYLSVGLRLFWSGVDLFFVLSGFLIGGILLDARDSPRYFRAFYVRRVFRILPIYGVALAAFYLLRAAGGPAWIPTAHLLFDDPMPWYSYVTFTQNLWMAHRAGFGAGWLSVTWSLAIEEQFYLTLPAVIRVLSAKATPYVLGCAVAATPLLRLYLYFHYGHGPLVDYFLMPCRADALLLGVLAAFFVRRPGVWEALKRGRGRLVPVWVVLLLGVLFFTLKSPAMESFWMTSMGYTWLAFTYLGLLLLALLYADGWLGRFFRARWLAALGTISYGVYLLHQVMLGICYGVAGGWSPSEATWQHAGIVFAALVLTLGIAQVSWIYFEKPLLRIGHRTKY